jgi:hypothetical protein
MAEKRLSESTPWILEDGKAQDEQAVQERRRAIG